MKFLNTREGRFGSAASAASLVAIAAAIAPPSAAQANECLLDTENDNRVTVQNLATGQDPDTVGAASAAGGGLACGRNASAEADAIAMGVFSSADTQAAAIGYGTQAGFASVALGSTPL